MLQVSVPLVTTGQNLEHGLFLLLMFLGVSSVLGVGWVWDSCIELSIQSTDRCGSGVCWQREEQMRFYLSSKATERCVGCGTPTLCTTRQNWVLLMDASSCWNGKLSGPLLLSKGEAACEVLLNKNLLLSFPFPYWQHLFFLRSFPTLFSSPSEVLCICCQLTLKFLLPSVEIGMILYFFYPSQTSALCLFTFTVTGQELETAEPGWDRCEEAVRSVWVLTPSVNGQLPSQFRPSSHTISIYPGALAAEPCAGSIDCFRNRKCCKRKLKE